MSIITLDFLNIIAYKYKFFNLINHIDTREKRMNLERIFSILCNIEEPDLVKNSSIFGDIMDFIHWGYTYEMYDKDSKNENHHIFKKYKIIKVWTGR